MWLFTRYGFYSVVQARRCEGGQVTSTPDPEHLMVRARVRQHLINLQDVFPKLLDFQIQESLDTDYPYRIILPRQLWRSVAQALTEDINYVNFKDACETDGLVEDAYTHALHEIWMIHYDLTHADEEDELAG